MTVFAGVQRHVAPAASVLTITLCSTKGAGMLPFGVTPRRVGGTVQVLLLAAALALVAGKTWAWLVWVALFGVLLSKASLEERWLGECHPLYASYRQRSKRFVPWLF